MDIREQKGFAISQNGGITREGDAWIVPSETDPRMSYRVIFQFKKCTCTCEDFASFASGKGWCKHIWAVYYWVEVYPELGPDRDPVINRNSTRIKRKPTKKRDWREYNNRKQSEPTVFPVVLAELCKTIPPPRRGLGRPAYSWSDIVFAIILKVYSRGSGRDFAVDLADACERQQISRPPHRNTVTGYMGETDLTPILDGLIVATSSSFRAVETEFAVDSTGIGAGRHSWCEEKHGKSKQRRDWAKAHIMCGVISGIVTAIEVTENDPHDSRYLPGLLAKTVKRFDVQKVCADNGYASTANMAAIIAAGATPYLAFKDVTTGGIGGVWQERFRAYQADPEEYDGNCRLRNAAEAVFSAVKRNCDDTVRAKDAVAIKNEVLAKFVAHNICCVIKQMSESGIDLGEMMAAKVPA